MSEVQVGTKNLRRVVGRVGKYGLERGLAQFVVDSVEEARSFRVGKQQRLLNVEWRCVKHRVRRAADSARLQHRCQLIGGREARQPLRFR